MIFLVYQSTVFDCYLCVFFFFQAEDGIRDLVRSRGLGDVYKRQGYYNPVGYAHDGYVNNDTMFAGHIYAGQVSIVDLSLIHI